MRPVLVQTRSMARLASRLLVNQSFESECVGRRVAMPAVAVWLSTQSASVRARGNQRRRFHVNDASRTPFVCERIADIGLQGVAPDLPENTIIGVALVEVTVVYDHLLLLDRSKREQHTM